MTNQANPVVSQYEILQELKSAGINVVHCGMCGDANLVRLDEDEHTCWACGYASESCDFPDIISEPDVRHSQSVALKKSL